MAIPIFLESGHNKANGTIHTGNDGDVAYSTFTNPKGPLIAQDNSLRAPQIDEQIVRTVTNQRTSLQSDPYGKLQLVQRYFANARFSSRIDQPALGIVFNHFEPSLSLTWLSICVFAGGIRSYGRGAAGSFFVHFRRVPATKSDFL